MLIKYQRRMTHENWLTVQISSNSHPNIMEATLDSLQRAFPRYQLRAISDDGRVLAIR